MNIASAEKIIDGYVDWWRKSFSVYQEGEAVRIVCPMLDRHNDHMSIYLVEDKLAGGFILSDLGAVINDLSMSGCDIIASESRRQKLDQVVQGFGLMRSGSELYSKTNENKLFQSMNMLMQGMASIDDLFFTARENIRNFFLEDVAAWLDAKGIRYLPDVRVSGRSGFESKFEFVIPKSGNIAPERYIKTISTPSEQSIKNALFGWNDINSARGGDAHSYLFLNKSNTKENSIDSSLIDACMNYEVTPVVWDNGAESVLGELAA